MSVRVSLRSVMKKPTVLMVSKPVAPPWNDSSKNLVKDLAQCGHDFFYRVLTPKGMPLKGLDGETPIISEPIYQNKKGSFSPALMQNLRVLVRLAERDATAITNFFFAPNLRAAQAARWIMRFRPRRIVQTVCSIPSDFSQAQQILFGEKIVVLSAHTRARFIEAGIAPERIVHIPPGIQLPAPRSSEQRALIRRRYNLPQDEPVVIYAGDYQFSQAAQMVVDAVIRLKDKSINFVLACRIKQPASQLEEQRLTRLLVQGQASERVRMLNEVENMLDLLGACDVCVLPAESLYAKMDLPLVLLEAMALGLPIIVADQPPLSELLDGEGEAQEAGLKVPPGNSAALAEAIIKLTENQTNLRKSGAAARRIVEQRYDIRLISKQYENLYQQMLEGQP